MLNLHIERKKKELEKASRKRKGRRMQEANSTVCITARMPKK